MATLQSPNRYELVTGIVLLPGARGHVRLPEPQRLASWFPATVVILQILHVYPIPGSQASWGLVVMCVPCAIAVGIAMQQVPSWRQAPPVAQTFAIAALGLVFLVGAGLSPISDWHSYSSQTGLGVPARI